MLLSSMAPHPKGTSYGDAEASPSGRSTQRQGDKRQRRSRRNRVKCTIARRFAQSTSEWPKTLPRGSNGGRSPLGLSFSTIFLQTKKDGATGGRQLPNAAGKYEKQKDIAPGGPTEKNAASQNVKQKDHAPGGRSFRRAARKTVILPEKRQNRQPLCRF